MTKKRELNLRQRKLIKATVEGKKRKEAGIEAGYSPKTAESQASQTLAKPNVREAFLKAMEKAGITDDRLSQVMAEGLEAKRTISAVTGNDATGKTMDFIEVPDHGVRHKFLDTAIDVKGAKAAKQLDARVTGSWEDLLNTLDDEAGDSETTAG